MLIIWPTHAKVHMEKFHCSTCGKQFASKERLAAHKDCHKKGLKCSKQRLLRKVQKFIGVTSASTNPSRGAILLVTNSHKKIGVYRCVKGCHYYARNTYNFNRHLESCRRFKAEKGIDQALSDNLNRLGDHYMTTQLEYKARTAVVRHSTWRLFVSRTSTTS